MGIMKNTDVLIIEEFKTLVQRKVEVREIRAFGSRARGDATPESDLDVLVVIDHLDHSIERYISDCAWEVGFDKDVVVVPVVVSEHALKGSPLRESVFIKNVYREGISI